MLVCLSFSSLEQYRINMLHRIIIIYSQTYMDNISSKSSKICLHLPDYDRNQYHSNGSTFLVYAQFSYKFEALHKIH